MDDLKVAKLISNKIVLHTIKLTPNLDITHRRPNPVKSLTKSKMLHGSYIQLEITLEQLFVVKSFRNVTVKRKLKTKKPKS